MASIISVTVYDKVTRARVSGASVKVGGKSATTNTSGQAFITVSVYGSLTLTVTKSGYLNYSTTITVRDGVGTSVSPNITPTTAPAPAPTPTPTPTPTPIWENVYITSIPAPAESWIDGTPSGGTPINQSMRTGTYSLKLMLAGYDTLTTTFTVTAGTSFYKVYTLSPVGAAPPAPVKEIVKIESDPSGAIAVFNILSFGTTPYTTSAYPGTYPLIISKSGYNMVTDAVRVVAGASWFKKYVLTPIMVTPVPPPPPPIVIPPAPTPIVKQGVIAQYQTSNDGRVADWIVNNRFANSTYQGIQPLDWFLTYETVFVCGGQDVNPVYRSLMPYGFPELTPSNNKPVLSSGYITYQGTKFIPCAGYSIDDTVYVTANNIRRAMNVSSWGEPVSAISWLFGLIEIGQWGAIQIGNIDKALNTQLWAETLSSSDKSVLNALSATVLAVQLLPLAWQGAVWTAGKLAPTLSEAASSVENARILASKMGAVLPKTISSGATDDIIKGLVTSPDDLARSLSPSSSYETIKAKVIDWVARTDKSLITLERESAGLSAVDREIVMTEAAKRIYQGKQTLYGLMASKAVTEQLPKAAWYASFGSRVGEFLWAHKVALIASSPAWVLMYIGGTSLGGFLLEETLQSAEYAVSFSLNIYRDDQYIGNAELEGVIDDAIKNYENILASAKGMQILMRNGQILTGAAVDLYLQTSQSKLDTYKRDYAILKQRTIAPVPSELVVRITASPLPINVSLDGKAAVTYWASPFDVQITLGTHTLVFSKEPDYAQQTRTFTVFPMVPTIIPTVTLQLKAVVPPIVPPIVPPVPTPTKATVAISGSPDGAYVDVDLVYTYKQAPTSILVDAGRHTITVRMTGYYQADFDIELNAGEYVPLTYSLTAIPPEVPPPYVPPVTPPAPTPGAGLIDISTIPGSVDVTIPGIGSYTTDDYGSLQLQLSPGSYELAFTKTGYATESRTVYLGTEQHYVLRVILSETYIPSPPGAPTAWRYDISSIPSGGKILIDGSFQDKWTPDYVILEPNAYYLLSVEKSGYYPAYLDIYTDPL